MSSKYDDKLFNGAKAKIFEDARETSTDTEDFLWQELRNRKPSGQKLRCQHPINNYVADFYCCEKQLVIDADGIVHNTKVAKEYDETRTNDLASRSIHVLRFTNEVKKDIPIVLKRITDNLKEENAKS
jgi:very-short-patch-repair endonuclease